MMRMKLSCNKYCGNLGRKLNYKELNPTASSSAGGPATQARTIDDEIQYETGVGPRLPKGS